MFYRETYSCMKGRQINKLGYLYTTDDHFIGTISPTPSPLAISIKAYLQIHWNHPQSFHRLPSLPTIIIFAVMYYRWLYVFIYTFVPVRNEIKEETELIRCYHVLMYIAITYWCTLLINRCYTSTWMLLNVNYNSWKLVQAIILYINKIIKTCYMLMLLRNLFLCTFDVSLLFLVYFLLLFSSSKVKIR